MLLAACTPIAADASANSPTAVNVAATLEVTAENQATSDSAPTQVESATPDPSLSIGEVPVTFSDEVTTDDSELVEETIQNLDAEQVAAFLALFENAGIVDPNSIEVTDLYKSNLNQNDLRVLMKVVVPDETAADGTGFSTNNYFLYRSPLPTTLEATNPAEEISFHTLVLNTQSASAALGVKVDGFALNSLGHVMLTQNNEDGSTKIVGVVDLRGQYVNVAQMAAALAELNAYIKERNDATATVEAILNPTAKPAATETASFAEPTMDNIEFVGDIDERFLTNQFPLERSLLDGDLSYVLSCKNDEVITASNAEIMSPAGTGTGIFLIAGAECWYKENDQQNAAVVPLVTTDHQQTVKAGFAIQDYDPRLEQLATEITWNSILGDAGFTGRGHIFATSVGVPRYDNFGTNQGLGDEELGLVYTQELIDQFASDGDLSKLPYVIIGGIRYPVLPPFDIGMVNTLNR
jgi:hypothetical protein